MGGMTDADSVVRRIVSLVISAAGTKVLSITFEAITGLFLLVLFLGFFLVDIAADRSVSTAPWRAYERKIKAQIRTSLGNPIGGNSEISVEDNTTPMAMTLLGRLRLQMQVYMQRKSALSFLKTVLIGGMLALLGVDLW